MTAADVIRLFDLELLTREGGYYRETYRSECVIPQEALPALYTDPRACSTAIYYLLTADTFSHMHRLTGDEIFHFYLGDPVSMLQLHPDGTPNVITLGHDIAACQHVQVVVPGGMWQGMKLADGGEWALMGTTVAPGFDYGDYEQGDRGTLVSMYPDREELIRELTLL